ncbi:MAG: hypothetical protein KKH94_08730, partial [Candidatus Omnitrophica bacterium]|nr:hypothetical protein [Candidatus Omnitrophota bacterium]
MALKGVLLRIRLPIIVVMHIAIVIVSYIFAFYIRFDFMLSQQEAQIILRTILVLILVKGCIFYFFNLFSGMWKYVSMEDMWQILKANSAATVSFVLFIVFTHGLIGYPRSVFILDWVLCTGFIAGIRFLSRSFRERFIPIKGQKR